MGIIVKQSGHVHVAVVLVLVTAMVAGVGYRVYSVSHKPSKITDAATKTQLAQTAAELKKLDLGSIAKTVNAVSNVQTSFDYKKANGQ